MLWRINTQIYATEVHGYLSAEMADLIIQRGEPMYATGVVYGFHDWLAMTNYDSQSRVKLTAWIMRHRAESRLHIALRSRIVAMGVAVANLALGDLIRIHADRTSLEAAFAEVAWPGQP